MKPCCETYLNEQFGGDADIVADIYAEYVSSLHAKIDEADAAFAARDWKLLDRAAHTVKGDALSAGDEEIAAIGIRLRQASQLEDQDAAATLLAELREAAKTVV